MEYLMMLRKAELNNSWFPMKVEQSTYEYLLSDDKVCLTITRKKKGQGVTLFLHSGYAGYVEKVRGLFETLADDMVNRKGKK